MGPARLAHGQARGQPRWLSEASFIAEIGWLTTLALPVFLGLIGFLEPCSIGSTLVMVKQMEEHSGREKIVQMLVFATTRGLFIGLPGLKAAGVGSAFLGWQKGAWLLLGVFYVVLGAMYLGGRVGLLMRAIGPGLRRLRGRRGAAALGLLFSLNISACAAPLILAMLGLAATSGTGAAELGAGIVSLGLFGLPGIVVFDYSGQELAMQEIGC